MGDEGRSEKLERRQDASAPRALNGAQPRQHGGLQKFIAGLLPMERASILSACSQAKLRPLRFGVIPPELGAGLGFASFVHT